MQFPKESHRAAMKQYLRYLRGSTTLGLFFKHACSDIPRLIGYLDSSHNIDLDDGWSTAGHIFYFSESLITWCKQENIVLSSCEAEFMAGTKAARQAIWLQEFLSEIMEQPCEKVTILIDNQYAISLTKNPVFHERNKYVHSRYHFIRECVEKCQIIVYHVPGDKQKTYILTKALERIKFKEMRDLIGVQDLAGNEFKLKWENVEISLK